MHVWTLCTVRKVATLTKKECVIFAFASNFGIKHRRTQSPDLSNRTVRQSNPIEHQLFHCRTQSNIIELTIKFCQSNTIEHSITERLVIEQVTSYSYKFLAYYVDFDLKKKIVLLIVLLFLASMLTKLSSTDIIAVTLATALHVTLGHSGEPGESNGCSEVPSAYYNTNFKHNCLCCCCRNGAIFLC